MSKKLLQGLVLFVSSISFSYAMTLYVGPAALYNNIWSGDIEYEGILPSLSVGIDGNIENEWYLAGEVFGNLGPATITNDNDNIASLRPSYSMGMSLLPGYYLSDDVVAYIRGGVLWTKFNSFGHTPYGGIAGVGLKYQFANAWDVRLEGDFIAYKRMDDLPRPRAKQLGLGVLYHFC